MAMALRRRRSWASMKARCGSQAEAVGATGGGGGVGVGGSVGAGVGAGVDAGGQGGGICCAGPAPAPGESVATPGEFAGAAANCFW